MSIFAYVLMSREKVLISNKAWIQMLDATPERDATWGDFPLTDMYIKGDLDDAWVFSTRKPSAVLTELKEMVSNSIIKVKHQFQIGIERLYDIYNSGYARKIRFLFERHDEETHVNVTTPKHVKSMLKELLKLPRDETTLARSFDCEAVDLGIDGITCYLQIQDNLSRRVYLVDFLTLGQKAWTTEHDNHTLKSLFEDPNLIKLIYDVRGDSDALRRSKYTAAMSSSKCLHREQQAQWSKDKNYPFHNDYSVFMERSLSAALKAYSINDVLFLDILAKKLIQDAPQGSLEVTMDSTRREIEWTHEACYYEDHYNMDEDCATRAYVKDEFAADWRRVHGR